MGPQIVSDDFETPVFPVDNGTYYRTTFADWQQLLAARDTLNKEIVFATTAIRLRLSRCGR